MKKISLILILSLLSIAAFAQSTQYIGTPKSTVSIRGRLSVDSLFMLPATDTARVTTPIVEGAMLYQISNSTVYFFNGFYWVKFSGDFSKFLNKSDSINGYLTPYAITSYAIKDSVYFRHYLDSVLAKRIPLNPDTIRVSDSLWLNGEWHSSVTDIVKVDSVQDMEAYRGEANIIIVTDSLRGGLFYKSNTDLTPDEGITFNSASGGVWMRQFNRADGISIEWYGASPHGDADVSDIIQNLVLDSTIHKIIIPRGVFRIDKQIGRLSDPNPAPSYAINHDVEILGTGDSSILRVGDSEIPTVFGFYVSGNTITFKNLKIDGNLNANRGIYFKNTYVSNKSANAVFENVTIVRIYNKTNLIGGSAMAIDCYGAFDKIRIKDCYIDSVLSAISNVPTQAIFIGGYQDKNKFMQPSNTLIEGNIIKNIFKTSVLTFRDQDCIVALYGHPVKNFYDYNLIIQGNSIYNCRGRFIKVQQENAYIKNNFMRIDSTFVMSDSSLQGGIDVGYSDAVISNNTIVYNSNKTHAWAISITQKIEDTLTTRSVIEGNKVYIKKDTLPVFSFISESIDATSGSGPGKLLNSVVINNNSISGLINNFCQFSGQVQRSHVRMFTFFNNTIDSIVGPFLLNSNNGYTSNLYATAISNVIRQDTVQFSNKTDRSILINNIGFDEPDTYLTNNVLGSGIFSTSANGSTTSFPVSYSFSQVPSYIIITPSTSDAAAAGFYPSTITTTGFNLKVSGTTPQAGTSNVKVSWIAYK